MDNILILHTSLTVIRQAVSKAFQQKEKNIQEPVVSRLVYNRTVSEIDVVAAFQKKKKEVSTIGAR
jgi:hypothetical protein